MGLGSPRRPRPAGWHKTIADLMAEKRTISGEEIEWARSYERDQLRGWARFPKDGEVYEAVKDLEVNFLVHWQAPFTGGGTGPLPKGSRVRVMVGAPEVEPIAVYAMPIDDGELERRLVPEADRKARKYGGFSLSLGVAELNRDFRLVTGAE